MSEQERRTRGDPRRCRRTPLQQALFSEVVIYYDGEAVYFEHRGKDSGIVRFTFEMLATLGQVAEDEVEENEDREDSSEPATWRVAQGAAIGRAATPALPRPYRPVRLRASPRP